MADDPFQHRARSLEERFFASKDADLLEKLRQKGAAEITKKDIADATGIQDEALLDRLVKLDVNVQTLAALSIVPLVEVAWADGSIAESERKTILKAALESGIAADGPGYRQLEAWLDKRPDAEMLAAWKHYIAELASRLDQPSIDRVRDNLLTRAKQVATSAGGGILGLGAVSPSEKRKLDELEAAFRK